MDYFNLSNEGKYVVVVKCGQCHNIPTFMYFRCNSYDKYEVRCPNCGRRAATYNSAEDVERCWNEWQLTGKFGGVMRN